MFEEDFCFCTFTSGPIYRALTKLLALDLEKYAPGIAFIVLTDKPEDFNKNSNVLAFKHNRQAISYHHERRFSIAKSLSMYNSCIYLDADIRICAPVPKDMQWLPGITARSCTYMINHIQEQIQKKAPHRSKKIEDFEFYKKMACRLGLDIEADRVMYLNEFLFVVTRDSGKELEFLRYWDKLAIYSALNGHFEDPGFPIGMAAKKSGLVLRRDEMEGFDFFDDRIEKIKISKGQSEPDSKREYFDTQYRIEHPKRSFFQKVANKVWRKIDFSYRTIRLRIVTVIQDFDFYYRD